MAYICGWQEADLGTISEQNLSGASSTVRYGATVETGFTVPEDATIENIYIYAYDTSAAVGLHVYDANNNLLGTTGAYTPTAVGDQLIPLQVSVNVTAGQKIFLATSTDTYFPTKRGDLHSGYYHDNTNSLSDGAPDPFVKNSTGSRTPPLIYADGTSDNIPAVSTTLVADAQEAPLPETTFTCSIHDATTRTLVHGPVDVTVSNGSFSIATAGMAHGTEYLVVPVSTDRTLSKAFFATTQAAS